YHSQRSSRLTGLLTDYDRGAVCRGTLPTRLYLLRQLVGTVYYSRYTNRPLSAYASVPHEVFRQFVYRCIGDPSGKRYAANRRNIQSGIVYDSKRPAANDCSCYHNAGYQLEALAYRIFYTPSYTLRHSTVSKSDESSFYR